MVLSHALHDDGTTKIGLFCEFLNVLMWKIIIYLSSTCGVIRRLFMFFDYVTKSKKSKTILYHYHLELNFFSMLFLV